MYRRLSLSKMRHRNGFDSENDAAGAREVPDAEKTPKPVDASRRSGRIGRGTKRRRLSCLHGTEAPPSDDHSQEGELLGVWRLWPTDFANVDKWAASIRQPTAPDRSTLGGWIQAVDATVSASISAGVR